MDAVEQQFLNITLSIADKVKNNNIDIDADVQTLNDIVSANHQYMDSFRETLQSILDGVTIINRAVTEKLINLLTFLTDTDKTGYLGVVEYSCLEDKSIVSIHAFVEQAVLKDTTLYRFLHLLTRLAITVQDPVLIQQVTDKINAIIAV